MQPQAYLHSHTYHATVDALERIAADHDPADAGWLRSKIIEALGEIGGIWPASCYTGEDDKAGRSIMVTIDNAT
jgi:hypothetical protein